MAHKVWKMASEEGVAPEQNDPLIRPDTFWELIEKLLLHKTRDEQSRRRHNAALSALCRGHALPRLPREPKPKTNKPNNCAMKARSQEKLSIPNSSNGDQSGIKAGQNIFEKKQKPPKTLEHRSISVSESENSTQAKEAKSECLLRDLDIVYLKDTSIPVSERLWRYAIKNRKRSEKMDHTSIDENRPIPCIRSNEAIYLGLRKRMEERMEMKKVSSVPKTQEKTKRTHKCEHIQKIRSDIQVNNRLKGFPKVKRTPSFQNQQTPNNANKRFQKSTRSVPTLKGNVIKIPVLGLKENEPKAEKIETKTLGGREQLFSPWGTDEAWSGLTKLATVKSKERFDSKKALYNSVIKRRLNCGSQLDSLNKEIINKKNNPRTVINKEVTRKYNELKNEYLNLCYQESTLRHQISLLHAEIYMMQNKGFHRTPASVKTITFDSTPLHQTSAVPKISDTVAADGAVPMFPGLKAPRPLITSQQKLSSEKPVDKTVKLKRLVPRTEKKNVIQEEEGHWSLPSVNSCSTTPSGVCSIYSITPQIVSQYREPITLSERKVEKLVHRLPRMNSHQDTRSPFCTKF